MPARRLRFNVEANRKFETRTKYRHLSHMNIVFFEIWIRWQNGGWEIYNKLCSLLFVSFCRLFSLSLIAYRKIPNISPGLIEVRKHFLGGLYSGGLIFRRAYIRRAFFVSVRVSRPQNSLLYIAIIGKKGVTLGQNHLYFALKAI